MGHVLGATLKDCANDPNHGSEFENASSPEAVTDPAGSDGANETACGHGGGDAALLRGTRVPKVLKILVATCGRRTRLGGVFRRRRDRGQMQHTDPSAHGGDIETEKCPSNRAKAGQNL